MRDVEFQEHAVGAWRPVRRRLVPSMYGNLGWPWGPPVEFGYYPPDEAQRAAKLLTAYLADSGMGPNFWGESVPDESGGASVVLEVVFAPVVVQGQSLLPKQAFALAQKLAEKFTQVSGWTVSVQWSHTR